MQPDISLATVTNNQILEAQVGGASNLALFQPWSTHWIKPIYSQYVALLACEHITDQQMLLSYLSWEFAVPIWNSGSCNTTFQLAGEMLEH